MQTTPQWIYGRKPIVEALQSGVAIDKIMALATLKSSLHDLKTAAREANVPIHWVTPDRLERMVKGNHQGVIALRSLITYYELEDVLPTIYEKGETPLLVLLDHVTDVRNVGAIARSAWAAGAHALLLPAKGSAALNEDAVKTSAGALLYLPVCRAAGLLEMVRFLKDNGIVTIALEGPNEQPLASVDLSIPVCLVMGAEDEGISRPVSNACDHRASLPMVRTFDSYNVSVATGMALYEVMRQRG